MSSLDPEPSERSFAFSIPLLIIGPFPEPFTVAFCQCVAEAQLLEHAIKETIKEDAAVFGKASEQASYLEYLQKITLGQAVKIAAGSSKLAKQMAACVGFYDFVRMQWNATGLPESALSALFTDAVNRRNRLVHQFLVEVRDSRISIPNALSFLKKSIELFFQTRTLITAADNLSARFGSIAPDGSSLPRFKTTA